MDITKKINAIAIEYFEGNNSLFASKMGTSEANIRNYRTKIPPKLDFVVKLSKLLEINYEWLLEDSGEMKRSRINNQVNSIKEDDRTASVNQEEVTSLYKEVISLQKKVIELQAKLNTYTKSETTSNDPARGVARQLK